MSKLFFIGFLLNVLYFRAVSQTNPDSIKYLEHKIENAKEDTDLLKNLCLLSERLRVFSPDTALIFSRLAVELEKKLNYPSGRVRGYQSCCGVFYTHKNYDSSVYYLQKGLDVCIIHHFYNEENEYRRALNNIYFLIDDYTSVMKISTAGLASAEKINDKKWMAHYNNVLGCVTMKLKNFKLSAYYFSAHLGLARQINDKEEEAHAFLNLADLFIAEDKMPEAISAINNSLHNYETYITAFTLGEQIYAYNKLSEAYKRMKKNDSALKYGLRTIELIKKDDGGSNVYDIAAYYLNVGDIYNRLKQPHSALIYLRPGLAIAREIKHREIIRNAYEQLSVSFALEKQFDSAYSYQKLFSRLKDSILNENSERDILQRNADLQIERQKRIQQAELSRQQLWRNIIIGTSILAIIIVVMMYNRRRIKQRMLYQQQLNKQQNELMNTVIAVQDKERKRIAEDLHDTLGSILSAAKLKLSAIAETVNGNDQQNNYNDTLNLLDQAVNEMRSISHNLLPASLLTLGLVAGLRNLTDKISSKSGLNINFIAYGFKDRLDETIEVSIYRIILEAINNVVKHAKAKNVTVQLVQYESYINILVEDDGVGFDRSFVSHERGIGLNNILSRVDYMKGNIDIDTKPRTGTIINIDIPY